ncbi:MAG: nucleoside monophosphate kinase, partial [Verrucomicrobiota bacterium]
MPDSLPDNQDSNAPENFSASTQAAPSKIDLEVKDANLIFNSVWNELEQEVGIEGLRFPSEVVWLNGAPGAGKGTQTRFIQQYRSFTAPPIVVSELLKSPA